MKLFRDALAGIGTRFHLVGIYTLVGLLLLMTQALTSKDDDWAGLLVLLLLGSWAIQFAIFGLVYHAAVDEERTPPPSPVRLGLALFPTLLWLQIRLGFMVYAPMAIGAWGWHLWRTPDLTTEAWVKSAQYSLGPFFETTVLFLLLVATPVAIWLREHGRQGAPIRDGLRIFRHRWSGAVVVLAIMAPAVVIDSTLHYLAGPDDQDIVPKVSEGLAMILSNYLMFVALFAASRVVVWSGRTPATEPRPADPAAAPGPPA